MDSKNTQIPDFSKFNTTDAVEDRLAFLTPEDTGTLLAEDVIGILEKHGEPLNPTEMMYLGLFAGGANAELQIAKRLGIPEKNITLVDKAVPRNIQEQLTAKTHEFSYVSEQVGNYFQNEKKKFSIISALGAEYIITDNTLKDFVAALATLSKEGTIVIVMPYTVNDARGTQIWQSMGFEPQGITGEFRYIGRESKTSV